MLRVAFLCLQLPGVRELDVCPPIYRAAILHVVVTSTNQTMNISQEGSALTSYDIVHAVIY